ncbi:MAG: CotY/CotZ family spore coat protein [bacterium]|nr:CotY/CotZ family spore coat protein [bacterium]
MCNNNTTNCDNCVAEILKVIYILQQSVCPGDNCLETCDRGFLGQNCSTYCNTRPVMLYTCCGNGTAWAMPITKTATGDTSTVFRVEKIDGCCATFRVLAPNTDTTSSFPYMATNSFFTMDLNCCCVIRCLDDTFVECL